MTSERSQDGVGVAKGESGPSAGPDDEATAGRAISS